MRHLYCIASVETGEIFAENLTGRGSALRWIESRGLTLDHEDTDVEFEETVATFKADLAEWESRRDVYPQHLVEIEENIARMEAEGPTRFVWVKEDSCPKAGFSREWIELQQDPRDPSITWGGFWSALNLLWTTDFAD